MLSPAQTPLIRLSNLFPDRQVYAKCEFLAPSGSFKTRGASHLLTRLSRDGYSGPRPIPGHGPHRYRFHVLAVGCRVPDDVTSGKALMQAIAGQVIARGTLKGTYER